MAYIFIIIIIGLVILGLFMFYEAFGNQVKEEILCFPEWPVQLEEVTIFFISDIHRRSVRQSIIEQVKGKADLVLIGGDLTEKGVSFTRTKQNLEKLRQVAPVFFVWGNNDYEVNQDQLRSLLKASDVCALNNHAVDYRVGKARVSLIGIDDMTRGKSTLDTIMQKVNTDAFRILISHNPDIIHCITEADNISLVLSGHTHGGQIRIFGFGPYRQGDIRKINGTTLLISNGYGTTALPLRLGAKAETHLITITGGVEDSLTSRHSRATAE